MVELWEFSSSDVYHTENDITTDLIVMFIIWSILCIGTILTHFL